jgi:hypothetical protein
MPGLPSPSKSAWLTLSPHGTWQQEKRGSGSDDCRTIPCQVSPPIRACRRLHSKQRELAVRCDYSAWPSLHAPDHMKRIAAQQSHDRRMPMKPSRSRLPAYAMIAASCPHKWPARLHKQTHPSWSPDHSLAKARKLSAWCLHPNSLWRAPMYPLESRQSNPLAPPAPKSVSTAV